MIQFAARYFLKNSNACHRLAVHETKRPFYSSSAVWYWSSNVPADLRISVDRSILDLRLNDEVEQILSKQIDGAAPAQCANKTRKIDAGIVWPLLAALLCPLFVVLIAAFVWGAIIDRRVRLRATNVRTFYEESPSKHILRSAGAM